jgi:hypothetical protein
VYKAAPNTKIIPSHMEAINHWTLSREKLKRFINEKGISSNVLVLDDGELYSFKSKNRQKNKISVCFSLIIFHSCKT